MRIGSILYLIREGCKNLWSNRLMTLASIGVLISCMVLSGGAGLLSYNISSYMSDLEDNNLVLVYLDYEMDTLDAVAVGESIDQVPNVAKSELVSKEDALQQVLEEMGDDGSIFEGLLDDNPLPDAYRVTLQDVEKYDSTVKLLREIEGVQRVSGESDVLVKINTLRSTVTTSGLWIVALLVAVSMFIIINTIRVTMYTRRKEISIMKSVGGTDWFIRIPFIVEGTIIGAISGVLSTFLLKYVYENISLGIGGITTTGMMAFSRFFFPMMFLLVFAGIIFGGVGGVISITKYLKNDEGENDGW